MGAGQCDLYKGTYGDNVGNIPSELSGISMPNHQNAVTPEEKYIKYSLNPDNINAKGKAEAYESALGFNRDNAQEIICQIEDAIKNERVSPVSISKTDFGAKYKYRIPVKGANGQIKKCYCSISN